MDQNVKRICKSIKQAIKSKRISYINAFKKFDQDGNKHIDHKEFK